METVNRPRPLGITIIAIILGISAVLGLIAVILGLVALGAAHLGGALATAAVVALIIAAVFALLELFLAWGLWTLKPWAFWATAVIEAIRILDALYALFVQHAALGAAILGLIIPLIILIYLFADRNVRAAFHT
ncbi:MAG: hypothetical protein E6J22_02500 [Chloroflexi bacterium]|nr:MAG: hypothetical protein E6J22_02500 [Chloroflexota bacterium]